MTKPTFELKICNQAFIDKFGLPTYATQGSAGIDLKACIDSPITLEPQQVHLTATGIAIHIKDSNMVGLIHPRSGLGYKHGIVLANSTGVIDSDYQGEIFIPLFNRSNKAFDINPGDRIAQMLFMPVIQAGFTVVDDFEASERGSGGFGSTGVTHK